MMKAIVFALIIFCLIVPITSCSPAVSTVQDSSRQSLYDRVIRSGKIRCAYIIYPPACMKDPNTGKLSGIGIEVMELVAKKLNLEVEWTEEVGTETMIEGLNTDRYDIVATPVWTNAHRARVASFSNPLFFDPIYIVVRKGDRRFQNHWEQINSAQVKVATIDGGTAEVIAEQDFPNSGRLSIPQMTDISQLLLNVTSSKADVTFAEPLIVNRYLAHNPGTVEAINPEKPIRIFANSWMFRRGEFEFKAMLDTVLDEVLNSGAMDKIIAKYEKQPHEIYRVALPYQLPH